MQTIPQRLMEGAAPVWPFWAFVSGPRNPGSPMQIDSWTVSPDEGRVGRLQRCSSVTTLTSEKLPDEDNDDEKHDD